MRVVVSVPTGRPVSRGDLLAVGALAIRWSRCRCGRCRDAEATGDVRFWLLVGPTAEA